MQNGLSTLAQTPYQRLLSLIFAALLSATLSACGGGGGGGTTQPPPPAVTTSFTLSGNSASFTGFQNGAAPAPQSFTITVSGDATATVGAGISGGASQPTWLTFNIGGSGATRTLTVTANTASMTTGQSNATLVISATDATGKTLHQENFSVSLTVTAPPPTENLATNPASLAFDGPSGGATSLPLQFSLSPAVTTDYPFAIALSTDTGQWLTVDHTSGTIGSAAATVNIGVNFSGLSSGSHTGQVTITVTVDSTQVTQTVPVTLTVKENRLIVTAAGVGFSKVGTRSVLTRTVQVLSNTGRSDIPWSATADSSWISVTPSGSTGGNLVITADPTGLPMDITQFGNVTIASADTTVQNQQSVRVGLYVSSTAAAAASVSTAVTNVSASPVEPLVAVSQGGTGVDLYNVYTGSKVTTLTSVGAAVGQVSFSEDGRTLYVFDTTNLKVNQINLQTSAVLASYDASNTSTDPFATSGESFALLHPDGYPTLVTPGGRTYDLASGTQYATVMAGYDYVASIAVSPDQSLIAPQFGEVARIIRTHDTAIIERGVAAPPVNIVQNRGNGQSCFSITGDRLYTASGAPYNFPAISIATSQVIQTLPGSNYPDAIQCVWNGLVVGGIDGYYNPVDIFVYEGATGVSLGQLSSNGSSMAYRDLSSRGLAVSADGTIVISAWASSPGSVAGAGIYFQSLPAPPP
jgi:hypothetical protein